MAATQEIIELENITRIHYNDEEDNDDSSFRILDWLGDKNGSWNKYVRDYHGTGWYGPYGLDPRAQREVRSKLLPAAEKLGIDLERFGDLAKVNIEVLVDSVATKTETRTEKIEPISAYEKEEITIDVYQMKDGRVIHLRGERNLF